MEFDAEAYLDAVAPLLGLEIAPDWRDEVILNLERTAALAELVMDFELGPEDEPAPVFQP